jgi:hypothetical protein
VKDFDKANDKLRPLGIPAIRAALPASAVVLPKMWEDRPATRIIWRRWPIPNMRSTKTGMQWRGHFDPEVFSLAAVNQQLRKEL